LRAALPDGEQKFGAAELLANGFVKCGRVVGDSFSLSSTHSKVFPSEPQPGFINTVLACARAFGALLGPLYPTRTDLKDKFTGLDVDAALASRNLIRAGQASQLDAANFREVFAAVARFETGKPQEAFADFGATAQPSASV
jgi:hypothetical protein